MADDIELNDDDLEATDVVLDDPDADGGEGGESDVEVVTDAAPTDGGDDEVAAYSERVQKRIGKLTKDKHKLARERDEAIAYAKKALAKANSLDSAAMTEHQGRLSAERKQIERDLTEATALNETAKVIELQGKLIEVVTKETRASDIVARRPKAETTPAADAPASPAAPVHQPAPAAAGPSPRAKAWAEKNPWFGDNQAATFAAFALHKEMIEDEGFDPESEEYYTELDRRIAEEIPNVKPVAKDTTRRATPAQQVAAPSRAAPGTSRRAPKGRKVVRLTKTQLAIARELGVSPEEYARHVKD